MMLVASLAGAVAVGAALWMLQRSQRTRASASARRLRGAPRASTPASPPAASTAPSPASPQALADFRLLDVNDLAPPQRERLREAIARMPRPGAAMQALASPAILYGEDSAELAALIKREPALAARVVATVNAPLYGLRSPIAGVGQAVTFLGLNTLRGIIAHELTKASFGSFPPALKPVHDRLWLSAGAGSELGLRLAKQLRLHDAGPLSTHVLLSFFGELSLLAMFGPAASECAWDAGLLDRLQAQRAALDVDAVLLGRLVMQEWELPATIVDDVEAIGHVIVDAPPALRPESRARSALGYASARMGEQLARGAAPDPEALWGAFITSAEGYPLHAWIDRGPLAGLPDAMRSADVRLSLEQFAASRDRAEPPAA